MGLVFLLLAFVPQTVEVRREAWPDGTTRAEYQVEVTEDGERREGDFRSWYASGTPESEGGYADDRKSGRWRFFHEDGSLAAEGSFSRGQEVGSWERFHPGGPRAAKGRYARGLLDGVWRFWHPDGSENEVDSGRYEHVSFRSEDGLRLFKGYRLDGERHGEWVSYWPDLTPQLEARFVRGVAQGEWRFHHPDGRLVGALSGRYQDGVWAGELAPEVPEEGSGGVARWAPEPTQPFPGGPSPRAEELAAALEEFLALPGVEPLKRWNEWVAAGRSPPWIEDGIRALPVVLERLQACDPDTPAGRLNIGRLDALALRPLCGGRSLGAFDQGGPEQPEAARAFLDGWSTLWAATRGDAWFWRVGVPYAPLQESDRLLRTPPIFDAVGYGLGRRRATPWAQRFEARRLDAREKALRAALEWLAQNQFPDGHWGSHQGPAGPSGAPMGGSPGYDVGVTGLALLALLGAGNTPSEGPHRAAVTRAVAWLLSIQGTEPAALRTHRPDPENPGNFWIQHEWLYEHAVATQALCEVQAFAPDPGLEAALRRALEVVLLARNPYSGWRYDLPPTGQIDTSMTGWMLHALLASREAGLALDVAEALEGGRGYLAQATDAANGRTGYTEVGELSSRTPANEHFPLAKNEALTAVALLARVLCGETLEDSPLLTKSADLIASKPPQWDPDGLGIDMYAWFHGTYALFQVGKPWWPDWEKALGTALLRAQRQDGAARGSWDPIGVWGFVGGRVYATALMALCLEVEFRQPRLLETR